VRVLRDQTLPEPSIDLDEAIAGHHEASLAFERFPFDHPWYVLYSSGTTGPPKCIVHRAGGVLLQHRKEHVLHCDMRVGDRSFWFTTCGWMMWNWLATTLATGATAILYDGSPFFPHASRLFGLADDEQITHLGVSAKFIDATAKSGDRPANEHSLESVRMIGVTGSPLSPEGFRFAYKAIKADVHLASISGGTDLCGCFVGSNPTGPVWAGEIQGPALAMAVDVYDDDGRSLRQSPGELVCTEAFPSLPLGFWNDPDGSRYRSVYYERFPGVWAQGDFATITDHGGVIVHGRSDTTLNPGGVRIGTAEIYRQVDKLAEVVESLVFGQIWEGDARIVLLVRLADFAELTDELQARIRDEIRVNCTPRHVPAVIAAVHDLPRTRSGKLVELAVADAVNGRPVRNTEAIANPEAIDAIRNLTALR
jgi:acetoacetyl-CoA synthetase